MIYLPPIMDGTAVEPDYSRLDDVILNPVASHLRAFPLSHMLLSYFKLL